MGTKIVLLEFDVDLRSCILAVNTRFQSWILKGTFLVLYRAVCMASRFLKRRLVPAYVAR